MKKNKMKSAFSAVAACSLSGIVAIATLAPMAQIANAEVTSPVGFVKLTFNAESDTPFSLPMNRPKVYIGQVNSISGNTINIANADFTASELVYADGSQNEKYYLLFTTGTLEGRTFDVTANDTDSITVDQGGDTDVQTLNGGNTDDFEIRPHWTLNTVFPDGANFDKSTDPFSASGLIMVRLETEPGEFIPVTTTYLYYDSSTNSEDGWYNANDLAAGKANDVILKQTVFYACKNKSLTDYTVSLVGDVPLVDRKVSLRLNADGVKQGNYIALAFPVEMSLAESNLAATTGFRKSTDPFEVDGDRVLLYADNITNYNPAPSVVYIYYDSSTNSEDGWYNANDLAAGKQDDVKVFKPGKGYIISKQDDFEEIFQWNINLPYNPFIEN
jgi:uncharacterized protein (TIGR02597 family)